MSKISSEVIQQPLVYLRQPNEHRVASGLSFAIIEQEFGFFPAADARYPGVKVGWYETLHHFRWYPAFVL